LFPDRHSLTASFDRTAHVDEQFGYDGDMLTRYVLVGLVLAGCGKPDATQQQGAPAPAVAPPPAGAPTPPVAPAPPPAAEPPRAGSNAPKDEPVQASTSAERDELERAIAPYIEQARKSYPDAKKRYLAGLPPGQRFSIVTKLHSPGRVEAVFVTVTGIKGDQVTGRIDSDVRGVAGYKVGDSYTLSERDIVDWVIVRPDGSEEGNLVGKFLEERNAKQHP
jgi:uncharacterized protein YegJ (DUF2314 family)